MTMNLRDLNPHTLKRIAIECRDEFTKWLRSTDGKVFKKNLAGMNERVDASPQDIWETAFSCGARAILRRTDNIKDNT